MPKRKKNNSIQSVHADEEKKQKIGTYLNSNKEEEQKRSYLKNSASTSTLDGELLCPVCLEKVITHL